MHDYTFGFSLTFAALFSKVWRLNRLMKKAASFRRVTVTVRDVMLPLVALLVLDIILLSGKKRNGMHLLI